MTKNSPPASASAAADVADARASDPAALGWMHGSPPSPDRTIRYDDGSFLRFPMWRWSFSHWRELVPTVNVPRGPGAPCPLPRAERGDLDAIRFTPLGEAREMSWAQSLDANYTDGIVVLHRGNVVYERVFRAAEEHLSAVGARLDGRLPGPEPAVFRRFAGLPRG